jgi:hypothetical protein
MSQFDPSTKSVDEVLKKLEGADPVEQQAILNAERGGKKRVTILEPYGIDPDARVDSAGRELYPWEVDPADHVFQVEAEETDEQREYREAKAAEDEAIAAATAAQPAADAPGTGVAPAPATGADAGTASGTASTGGTSTAGGAGL